jgi:integrase
LTTTRRILVVGAKLKSHGWLNTGAKVVRSCVRTFVLVPQLEKLLKAHRLASPFSGDDDFVFPGPDGRGQDHRAAGRKIERAVKKAELGEGISAHAFRHTFASLLIVGLKLDPVNVAAQLGHSNPNVTVGTYSHLFDKARAADSMRTALGDGFGHLLAASS